MLVWLKRFIERHPQLHRGSVHVWRWFPPRLAGIFKGLLARNWVVGAAVVIVDPSVSPPEVLLAKHSYRKKGAWGLPGGSLESIPGKPTRPSSEPSPDDVIRSAVQHEVWKKLGLAIRVEGLLRIDAVPYIAEEPGPYRLNYYFQCTPHDGFDVLRNSLASGDAKPHFPEIAEIRFVPLTDLEQYDLLSDDYRFLSEDLPRLVPSLAIRRNESGG